MLCGILSGSSLFAKILFRVFQYKRVKFSNCTFQKAISTGADSTTWMPMLVFAYNEKPVFIQRDLYKIYNFSRCFELLGASYIDKLIFKHS